MRMAPVRPPARRVALQQALQAERRLRHRFPYRGDRDGRDAFHLARMDLPEVRAMAELYPIDQIFDNPAYPGILAGAFIDAGIPAKSSARRSGLQTVSRYLVISRSA